MTAVMVVLAAVVVPASLVPAGASSTGNESSTLKAEWSAADINIDDLVRILVKGFSRLDTAANGGKEDNRVSVEDLAAVAGEDSDLGRAAGYVQRNAGLFGVIDSAADEESAIPSDGISKEDLVSFAELNHDLRSIYPVFDRIDTAAKGGRRDGVVSIGDLKKARNLDGLPSEALDRLIDKPDRWTWLDSAGGSKDERDEDDKFSKERLIARLVNGHATITSPADAYQFVDKLPVAGKRRGGLNRRLFDNDGVEALYGAALAHAGDNIVRQQRVISHLPETVNAVRNRRITGFYEKLAIRADQVLGVSEHPESPGANWLDFAPWASAAVFDAIDGVEAAYGIKLSFKARQAAANGNQWIFNDITSRFAHFIDMYEQSNGNPSPDALTNFFKKRFGDGDEEIRHGFLLYAASLRATDPLERQRLMFMANVEVAVHEQAGVDYYLGEVSMASDIQASRYIELRIGRPAPGQDKGQRVRVQHDLKEGKTPSAIKDLPIFELAPSERPPKEMEKRLGISLPNITGWSDVNDPFELEPKEWFDHRGDYVKSGQFFWKTYEKPDPDKSLRGTGVGSWADFSDRMWFIYRMFEQFHTEPLLRQLAPNPLMDAQYELTDCYPGDDQPDSSLIDLVHGERERGNSPISAKNPYALLHLAQGPGAANVVLFECNNGANYSYGLAGLVDYGTPEPIRPHSVVKLVGGLRWVSSPPPIGEESDDVEKWHDALRLSPYEFVWRTIPEALYPGGYGQLDAYGVVGGKIQRKAMYAFDRMVDTHDTIQQARDACHAVAAVTPNPATDSYYIHVDLNGKLVATSASPEIGEDSIDFKRFDVTATSLVPRNTTLSEEAELVATLGVLAPEDSDAPFCLTANAFYSSPSAGDV